MNISPSSRVPSSWWAFWVFLHVSSHLSFVGAFRQGVVFSAVQSDPFLVCLYNLWDCRDPTCLAGIHATLATCISSLTPFSLLRCKEFASILARHFCSRRLLVMRWQVCVRLTLVKMMIRKKNHSLDVQVGKDDLWQGHRCNHVKRWVPR